MPKINESKVNEQMEKIVSLCKRRGFIFQSSEIYGGINGFWDYGPLGAELKRNVKDTWWRSLTQQRNDVVGLDATIIMHPMIWKASGHVDTFTDPMCDCLLTQKRFRADQIDPQSGIAYYYSGAVAHAEVDPLLPYAPGTEEYKKVLTELASNAVQPAELASRLSLSPDPVLQKVGGEVFQKIAERALKQPFAMLLAPGKHPEYARRPAGQFYESRGIKNPILLGERAEKVENSQRFNPENGALLTEPRPFNLMLQTFVGPIQSEENIAYLRPETAQAIFAQFKNVLETSRQKVPFGICQTGKAFRNEVTPRNFTFRSREFEQMELEFFIPPDEAVEALRGSVAKVSDGAWKTEPQPEWGWEVWHKYWVEQRIRAYESIGLPRASLEEYWQKPEELAHYAKATVDILFAFPFGTQELEGIAARGDFDLSQHQRCSGKPMNVFDEELKAAWSKLDEAKKRELGERYYRHRLTYYTKAGEPEDQAAQQAKEDADGLAKGYYVPHVIEPSAGVDRLVLALICAAYHEEQVTDEKGKVETRVVMKFHPRIAPIKVGVFPLLKNRPELTKKAHEVHELLRQHLHAFYDESGAIGRRYRRQDEAGTPFGVTIDFDTLGENPELKNTVTVRDRDTMKQVRVPIHELVSFLLEKLR